MKRKDFKKIYMMFIVPNTSFYIGYFISESIVSKSMGILLKGIVLILFSALVTLIVARADFNRNIVKEIEQS